MRLAYLALVLLTAAALPARAQTLPSGFYLENAIGGGAFTLPVATAVAPDGAVFVAEKRGIVWVARDGERLPTPLIDLQAEVLSHHDRGLLGITLAPDFAQSGHVYLLYTVDHDGRGDVSRTDAFARLTRYTVQAGNRDRADLGSRRVLLGGLRPSSACPARAHRVEVIRPARAARLDPRPRRARRRPRRRAA